MPRVAIVRHTFGVASEPFVLDQARSFSRWEPVLVSRDDLRNGLTGFSLDRRHRATHTAGVSSRPLARMFTDLKVDAVLAHFGVEAACALPATRRAGVPLATVFHGFDATTSTSALLRSRKISWITYARRLSSLARRGELFLPVSDHLRSRVLERGFPADRTITHHLGIDVSDLPTEVVDPNSVVHVGRLVPKKGHADLIRAMAQLPEARLTCVGDGPLLGELQGLAQELDVAVEFRGVLDHAQTLRTIARSAVLCLPSTTGPTGDQEGLGQVLLEAGAMGRPVVATRHGGIPSAVVDGVTGLLVPEDDPASLAAALGRVLRSPRVSHRLGTAAAEHVRTSFDVLSQTARLEELLDGISR